MPWRTADTQGFCYKKFHSHQLLGGRCAAASIGCHAGRSKPVAFSCRPWYHDCEPRPVSICAFAGSSRQSTAAKSSSTQRHESTLSTLALCKPKPTILAPSMYKPSLFAILRAERRYGTSTRTINTSTGGAYGGVVGLGSCPIGFVYVRVCYSRRRMLRPYPFQSASSLS